MKNQKVRGFEIVTSQHRKSPDKEIRLPIRSTSFSAGYDLFSTTTVTIPANGTAKFFTDVKAHMQEGEVLQVYVRSSVGIKKGLTLCNGTGIIGKDYYNNPDNDGNIGVFLKNNTNDDVVIEEGERVIQGVFVNFWIADNGNSNNTRVSGLGSTNK